MFDLNFGAELFLWKVQMIWYGQVICTDRGNAGKLVSVAKDANKCQVDPVLAEFNLRGQFNEGSRKILLAINFLNELAVGGFETHFTHIGLVDFPLIG